MRLSGLHLIRHPLLLTPTPRPYLEEPRNVIVHKGAEPLGISIVGGENGGIFVSKVTEGSIAHQAGLEYGDQLLEVRMVAPSSGDGPKRHCGAKDSPITACSLTALLLPVLLLAVATRTSGGSRPCMLVTSMCQSFHSDLKV